MTDQQLQTLLVCANDPAGLASHGEVILSKFWEKVQELLALGRLHANSDEICEIAARYDLDDQGRLDELERLAQKVSKQGADMLQSPTATNLNTNPSPAETARCESSTLAHDIRRLIMSKPAHIQMLAVCRVFAELVAGTVNNRQLGPVEGLLEDIEGNLSFDDGMTVRQYARGLAALIENIRSRLANL